LDDSLLTQSDMKDNAVILAVLLIISASIGPAWNLTIAELADATDTSATTMFQPELLISAWGSAIAAIAGGIVIYFTRNQPKP
jgi:hypothetical protein